MYTSPHLTTIRERIQIDSTPISEEIFARYFFEVWEALLSLNHPENTTTLGLPRYLQTLALLSMHIFIKEQVDAAIFETHNGGEYDATNVFSNPCVTGITTIGMDHVEQLGGSIENISWHKAGILKSGTPAFSSGQVPEAAAVLRQRAIDKEVALNFVAVDPALPHDAPNLKPEAQKVNSSLALSLTNCFLEKFVSRNLKECDVAQGVSRFRWIGRYHHIVDGTNHWFLDGAHNLLSIRGAGDWFATSVAQLNRQVLLQICVNSVYR